VEKSEERYMSNLGRQFTPIGYDYTPIEGHPNEGSVSEGTMCHTCKKKYDKSDPTWSEGLEESPIYRHEQEKRDPKKSSLIHCEDCGKKIWGKYDKDL